MYMYTIASILIIQDHDSTYWLKQDFIRNGFKRIITSKYYTWKKNDMSFLYQIPAHTTCTCM